MFIGIKEIIIYLIYLYIYLLLVHFNSNNCQINLSLMVNIIKPLHLEENDCIGLIAPSSALFNPLVIDDLKLFFEAKSFKVILGRHVYDHSLDFAGSAEHRSADFHEFIADANVKAIICLRGGNGAARLLPKLDFKLIKQNPKIIIGFSDITHLLLAINQKANLVTFHGPTGMGLKDSDFNYKMFKKALIDNQPVGKIVNNHPQNIYVLSEGAASGYLTGGCLTIITQGLGTDYEINTKDKILFIEDIGEEPYSIDKMLTRLKLSGKLNDACGIVFGQFLNCYPGESSRQKSIKNKSIEQILREFFTGFNKPVLYGYNFGHGSNNITIPIGIKANIKASYCQESYFEISECGTT